MVGWFGWLACWNLFKLPTFPFRDFIPSFNQIGWKMPKLCTFFTYRLISWFGGRPIWPVSMLKSLWIRYVCWVLPFRDYISSFNQIGWKMPKLCTFFTVRLVGWLDRLEWSDHNKCIGCKAAYPSTISLQIWSKSVKAFKSLKIFIYIIV